MCEGQKNELSDKRESEASGKCGRHGVATTKLNVQGCAKNRSTTGHGKSKRRHLPITLPSDLTVNL